MHPPFVDNGAIAQGESFVIAPLGEYFPQIAPLVDAMLHNANSKKGYSFIHCTTVLAVFVAVLPLMFFFVNEDSHCFSPHFFFQQDTTYLFHCIGFHRCCSPTPP